MEKIKFTSDTAIVAAEKVINIFEKDINMWERKSIITTPFDIEDENEISSIEINQNQFIVSAYGPRCHPEIAFIYENNDGEWVNRITFDDEGNYSKYFGKSVAITDGIAIVGMPQYPKGSVYLLKRKPVLG